MKSYVERKEANKNNPTATSMSREAAQQLKFDTNDFPEPGIASPRYASLTSQNGFVEAIDRNKGRTVEAQDRADLAFPKGQAIGRNHRFETNPIFAEASNNVESVDENDDDTSQLDSDRPEAGLESQDVNHMITMGFLSMGREDRQKAGFSHLERHFNGSDDRYAQSYPSTTSGLVEQSDDEAMSATPSLAGERHSSNSPPPVERHSDFQNHGSTHMRDLVQDYHSAAQTRAQTQQINLTPATGYKRKAGGLPTQNSGYQSPTVGETAAPRTVGVSLAANDQSSHASNFQSSGKAHTLGLGSERVPVREESLSAVNGRHGSQLPASQGTSSLDHDLETLYGMEFTALQNEPFDTDPSAESLAAATDQASESMTTRLDVVAHLPAEDQYRFLASLNLEEWEQAGEWFATKFRETAEKLVRSRKHRRAIAIEFEEVVARRHQAVTQETQSVQNSLKEMKARGSFVISPESPEHEVGP